MADKTNRWELDVTPSNNDNIDGNDIAELNLPSTVNNAMRALASFDKKYALDMAGVNTVGGTADAVTVTTAQTIASYVDGLEFSFIASADNTGAATIDVDSVGAKSIEKMNDGGIEALDAKDMLSGGLYSVRYQSSSDKFILRNPEGVADDSIANDRLTVAHSLALSHTVANRTALKALDISRHKTIFLQESGREGWFDILAGTPPTDTQEGIYVVLDTAGYYAKRIFDGPILDIWFGVVADDAADDTAAMQGLAAYMKANSGHYVFDGGTRRVWPTLPTTGDILMDVRGTNGLTVEYLNGASIHAIRPNSTTDSTSVEAIVWEITGCTNFTCINPKLEQEGAKVPPFTDGVFHFVGNYTSSAKTEGVRITGVDQTGGIGGLVMRSPSSSAEADISRDIHFEGKFDKVYYPFNLQGNGNDAHANIKTTGCGRAFFVYNVRNVRGNVTSDNNSGYDDVNISSYTDTIYQNETSNVHVNYTCRGHSNVSGAGLSAINFVQSDATSRSAKIRGISIHFDVDISTHGGAAINIRKYDHLGALDGTARGHALRDIKFSGLISSGSSGFQVDPLNVMSGSSWSGETVYNIEFDQLEFQDAGSNALNIDGAGINTIGGHIVFKECYFDSALTLSNMAGKLTVQGSRLGGKYYDGDYSGWKVTHKPKGRVTLTYQGQSIATGGGTTVTLPLADATGVNPSVVVTPVSGVAAAFGVNPISSSSFGVLHDQAGSQNFNIHVEMNY